MSMSVPSDTFKWARAFSDTLVETGTYQGRGVQGALLAGFEHVYTCEISLPILLGAKNNIGEWFGGVHYAHGSSSEMLPAMLRMSGKPSAVLLDAHVVPGNVLCEDAAKDAGTVCPLREELMALQSASFHGHLVLIDDIDLAGTHHLAGITLEEIVTSLLHINEGYRFRVLDGIRPRMLLAAAPPGWTPMVWPKHAHAI